MKQGLRFSVLVTYKITDENQFPNTNKHVESCLCALSRILLVPIKSSFSFNCVVIINRFTMNSQLCTCKSCHISLPDRAE